MNDISNGSRLNLQQFLQENMGPIEGIVRSYVIRMGLTHGESIQNTTLDILNDTTLEALVPLYVQLQQSPPNHQQNASAKAPLLALNATTGKLIWSVTTDEGMPSLGPGPITVTNGIVVLSNTATLCGYRASDGDQVWCQKKLPKSDGNAIISEQAQLRKRSALYHQRTQEQIFSLSRYISCTLISLSCIIIPLRAQ